MVSFIRKKGTEEILVLINLTNRITKIQVDVPAADYAEARDLLKNRTLPASLSADKFSCQLGAFDYIVAKRVAAIVTVADEDFGRLGFHRETEINDTPTAGSGELTIKRSYI